MVRVVVSDTSPLRYLVLIEQIGLIPALYGEVLIPEAVADELNHAATPVAARRWIATKPDWLKIVCETTGEQTVEIPDLDRGETEAIRLALKVNADLLLMDERDGVAAARKLGLTVTGTLGVLDLAARRDLIDLTVAIGRLRETNFRADPALFDTLLADDARRRKNP